MEAMMFIIYNPKCLQWGSWTGLSAPSQPVQDCSLQWSAALEYLVHPLCCLEALLLAKQITKNKFCITFNLSFLCLHFNPFSQFSLFFPQSNYTFPQTIVPAQQQLLQLFSKLRFIIFPLFSHQQEYLCCTYNISIEGESHNYLPAP